MIASHGARITPLVSLPILEDIVVLTNGISLPITGSFCLPIAAPIISLAPSLFSLNGIDAVTADKICSPLQTTKSISSHLAWQGMPSPFTALTFSSMNQSFLPISNLYEVAFKSFSLNNLSASYSKSFLFNNVISPFISEYSGSNSYFTTSTPCLKRCTVAKSLSAIFVVIALV